MGVVLLACADRFLSWGCDSLVVGDLEGEGMHGELHTRRFDLILPMQNLADTI